MDKRRRLLGIFLLTVYAFFFASTNLFVHSHEGPGSKIVHSHPFNGKAHDHTAGQILLINALACDNCLTAESTMAPEPVTAWCHKTLACLVFTPLSNRAVLVTALRAPPCI